MSMMGFRNTEDGADFPLTDPMGKSRPPGIEAMVSTGFAVWYGKSPKASIHAIWKPVNLLKIRIKACNSQFESGIPHAPDPENQWRDEDGDPHSGDISRFPTKHAGV